MWTLSRSTRSGRGSAATGSIAVSPVLSFGLLPLRRGFEIATALKRRSSCSSANVSMGGRAGWFQWHRAFRFGHLRLPHTYGWASPSRVRIFRHFIHEDVKRPARTRFGGPGSL